MGPGEGTLGIPVKLVGGGRVDRRPAVHRATESVEDAAQKLWPHGNFGGVRAGQNGIAESQPVGLFERHRQDPAVAKSDDLNADGPARGAQDFTEVADRRGWPGGFDEQPSQLDHFAGEAKRIDLRNVVDVVIEVEFHWL
jgi:hypothetical protein